MIICASLLNQYNMINILISFFYSCLIFINDLVDYFLSVSLPLLKYEFLCNLAGDDAKIRVWRVPEGGLKETLTEPELILQGRNGSSLKKNYILIITKWADSWCDVSQATQRRFTPSGSILWPVDCWCPPPMISQSDCGTWTPERRSSSSRDTENRWSIDQTTLTVTEFECGF